MPQSWLFPRKSLSKQTLSLLIGLERISLCHKKQLFSWTPLHCLNNLQKPCLAFFSLLEMSLCSCQTPPYIRTKQSREVGKEVWHWKCFKTVLLLFKAETIAVTLYCGQHAHVHHPCPSGVQVRPQSPQWNDRVEMNCPGHDVPSVSFCRDGGAASRPTRSLHAHPNSYGTWLRDSNTPGAAGTPRRGKKLTSKCILYATRMTLIILLNPQLVRNRILTPVLPKRNMRLGVHMF